MAFSSQLRESLVGHDQVIGLVLLGSTAELERVDEWSDHDFFVITKNGFAEELRQDLSWLPDYSNIVMHPRETAHGLKVVYADGHVLEFAVFEDGELELASANSFQVTLDRANIQDRMVAIAKRSKPKPVDLTAELEIFLAHTLIGVGRYRRGEKLTAGQFARTICLNSVLAFIRALESPADGTQGKEDNLNRYRRFEEQYPEFGEKLDDLQKLSAEECHRGLLEMVLTLLGSRLSESQSRQVRVVKDRLGWE